MTLLDELIDLHAKYGLSGLPRARRFKKLCDEHIDDTGFNGTLELVQSVQGLLEHRVEEPGLTHRAQVRAALEVLNNVRDSKEGAAACRGIVEKRYAKDWGDTYARYFDEAAQKVLTWNHYFLSFTSYNPQAGFELPINQAFKKLIREELGRTVKPDERQSANLVAELLDRMLSNSQLRGFYYVKHRDTRDVEVKLKGEAERSFAFVQIIESSMFGNRNPNYCFVEFCAAHNDPARRLIFVMPEPRDQFIARDLVHFKLLDWYERAMAKDAVPLTRVQSRAEAAAAIKDLRSRVIDQVIAARLQVYEDIPV
jgi:hypothetical protein